MTRTKTIRNTRWTIKDLTWMESKMVRAIRAHRSQGQINRKFQSFGTTWIGKVEQQRRRMLWSEFTVFSEYCKFGLAKRLSKYFFILKTNPNVMANEPLFIDIITKKSKATELANIDGWPYEKLKRLRSGKTPLRLVDVLAVFVTDEVLLIDFVTQIIPIGEWESRFGIRVTLPKNTSKVLSDPWLPIFNCILDLTAPLSLKENKESVRTTFSEFCGLAASDFESWLSEMKEAGALEETSHAYKSIAKQSSFLTGPDDFKKLRERITVFLFDHLNATSKSRRPFTFLNQYLTVDEKGEEEIYLELRQFRARAKTISLNCAEMSDRVVILESAAIVLKPE